MKVITRAFAILLVFATCLTFQTQAQQKRPAPAKPQPKPAAAPTPAPTFDNLLPADSYIIYGEVRGAGQLIRSNALNDLLEPILKLAGPPREFRSIVKWLNAHADEVMTSRLLVAAWPATNKGAPETIVAIEFASAEDAAKFATPLNEFLPTVLPPTTPEATSKDKNNSAPAEKPKPPEPSFHLQRLGSLVLITPKPWTMKQLKPAGSKPLTEDVNFRAARSRFNSEPIFVFIDVKAMERQDEERRKQIEGSQRAEAEQVKREAAEETKKSGPDSGPEPLKLTEQEKAVVSQDLLALEAAASATPAASPESAKEAPTPDPVLNSLSTIGTSLFGGETEWPDAIAVALSFEGDSFDLRALLLNAPGEKSNAIPFWPRVATGVPVAPESPSILPANTELFVMMSLDLPQIYTEMVKPQPPSEYTVSHGQMVTTHRTEWESPFAVVESRLKMNLKDELLPLLGSEVAVALPMNGLNIAGIGLGGPMAPQLPTPEKTGKEETANEASPILVLSVKDKEGVRTLMPKVIDALGFKGASSLAQTERREDTELVSVANVFAYAFIGNFLVLSADPATTRRVVDSYLKHETLSSDVNFKNYTRWQPRQLHGQFYISPALMESYRNWFAQPNTLMSDQTRAFLARVSMLAQPITYSLSNEGLGALHEMHLPKSLVLMAAAGISGEMNPPPDVQKERMAIGLMYMIASAEERYKESKGAHNYGTLEQLFTENLVPKEMVESSGYRFDVVLSGDKFEVSAVPVEYGKTGNKSFFMDQARVLRGGDRGGAAATASDPPIN